MSDDETKRDQIAERIAQRERELEEWRRVWWAELAELKRKRERGGGR